jgi:hypothetical protein
VISASVEAIQQKKQLVNSHKLRLCLFSLVLVGITAYFAVTGFSYYITPIADRPFHVAHQRLRPGGAIGVRLGISALVMFCVIYLYPLRKKLKFLRFMGSTKHVLDYHILLGLCAPIWVAMHSAFKFRGIAGVSFWIMLCVVVSGIVGRYLYSQIPRSRKDMEFSLIELEHLRMETALQLQNVDIESGPEWDRLFTPIDRDRVRRMSLVSALWHILLLDIRRPFHIAALRRQNLSPLERFATLGGFLASSRADLERIMQVARKESWLSAKIIFLDRASQMFHLWHVVHRPFSYGFVLLAILHIGLVTAMGFL